MELIFTSRNRLFFETFKKIFCSENDSIIFYDEIVNLASDLMSGKVSPRIILVDGFYFLPFKKFIFRFLNDFEREIPTIFLDGEVPKEKRAARWLSEIELCFDNPSYHHLIPVLEKIEKIICLPACVKAIEAGSKKILKKTEKLDLRQKILLAPINHLLYKFFFKNRRRIVYLDEIAEILNLKTNDEKNRKNTVYAYVSRFRKSIADLDCQYELLRICKGGYQLVLKN